MPKKTVVFSVRNFPIELNGRLKAEAALRGISLEKFFIEFVQDGLKDIDPYKRELKVK